MTENHSSIAPTEYRHFKDEITTRIRSAQYEALKAVNHEMIALYWEIGKRITEQQAALGWGKSVVETLSNDIQKEFPGIQGFSARNMWNMAKFYSEYQGHKILQTTLAESFPAYRVSAPGICGTWPSFTLNTKTIKFCNQ